MGLGVAAGATLQFNGALGAPILWSFAVKSGPGKVRLSLRFFPVPHFCGWIKDTKRRSPPPAHPA